MPESSALCLSKMRHVSRRLDIEGEREGAALRRWWQPLFEVNKGGDFMECLGCPT